MGVENVLFLLDAANDVDVAVGNDNSFWVVGEVVQVVELLDFAHLGFEVEEVAVSLFDGEDRYFFDIFEQIGRLGYGYASFVGLSCASVVDSRYGIAQHLRKLHQDPVIDLDGGALRDVLELVGPVHKLLSQEVDLFLVLLHDVVPHYLVIAHVLLEVPVGVFLDIFLELSQLVKVLVKARIFFEEVLPHVDELETDLRKELLDYFQGLLLHEAHLV
jgi:hypothetical protein